MKVYHIRAHYMCLGFSLFAVVSISTRLVWMQFPCHSISSHFPHPLRMPFALPFLMVATATLAKSFIKKRKWLMTKSCEISSKSSLTTLTMTTLTTIQKIRLTPYGASLIVLDLPVTFHQNCLSPLLSSRPWWDGRCGPGRANRTHQKMADLQLNKCYNGILFRPLGCFVGYLL